MAGQFLPPVVTRLEGNIDDLVSAVAKAKALIKSLNSDAKVSLDVGVNKSSIFAQMFQAKMAAKAAANAGGPIQIPANIDISAMSGAKLAGIAALARESRLAGAAAGGGGGGGGGLFGLSGNAWHWIIMGSAEILSTAIPAIIALGAALVGLEPTFATIHDNMVGLVTASGGMRNALLNSVAPLHNLGVGFGQLKTQMAPQAYTIFGAAINSLGTHMGAFSTMAKTAGQALAGFATHMQQSLSGPLGGQLTKMLADGVKYMIQWGQVLGNLAHGFMNAFSDMLGIGFRVLDVLDLLSRAFVAITGNPVIGKLIGIAAAFSGIYRFAKLLVTIVGFVVGTMTKLAVATAAWIAELIGAAMALPALIAEMGVFDGTVAALDALLGPVGWAILAIAAGFGLWKLATMGAADATQKLIQQVEKAPASVAGVMKLTNALVKLPAVIGPAANQAEIVTARFGGTMTATTRDATDLINAIKKQANAYINLVTGMAQAAAGSGSVAAGEQAMAIQTALSDSKVQALNQALDTYVGLLTSATGGAANFVTSMSNIGSVAATTTNNLGTSTTQLSLSAGQFAKALNTMNVTGAAAWTNLTQVMNGSIQPMMDNLRQLKTIGAVTGQQVSQAFLDMAAAVAPFIKGTGPGAQAAQKELLGMARANGIVANSYPQLVAQEKRAHASTADLAKIAFQAASAMSNLGQMAKNAANAMNSQVAGMIASAALKVSGFDKAFQKLQTDLMNGAPSKTLQADYNLVKQTLQDAGKVATTMSQNVVTGNQKAAAAATTGSKTQQTAYYNAKLKALELSDTMSNTLPSKASSGTGKVSADTIHMASIIKNQSGYAKAALTSLQNYINSLHGKTVNINVVTNYSSTGSPGAIPHHASGTRWAPPGVAWVGENGPELMYLSGGQRIIPNHEISSHLGGAGGGSAAVPEVHVYIDGRELFGSVKVRTQQYNVTNGNRTRGGRVRGTMVPRP